MTKTFSPALRLAAPLLALGLACTAFGTAHAAEPLLTPAGVQAAAGQEGRKMGDRQKKFSLERWSLGTNTTSTRIVCGTLGGLAW